MRLAALVYCVVVAGCVESTETARHSQTSPGLASAIENSTSEYQQVGEVTADPDANKTDPLMATRIVHAGLSWSECRNVSYSVYHRHEWQAGMVPPEYRPLNAGGGTGELIFRGLDCAAASIGNTAFLPGVQLSFFSVLVEAPPSVQGPSGNLYVLDFVTNASTLHEQIAELGLATWLGALEIGDGGYSVVTEEGPVANTIEATEVVHTGNVTGRNRLHWKTGGNLCWADLEHIVHVEMDVTVVVEGLQGTPYTLSGPAQRMAGLGTRSTESGHLSAPICVEVPQ